MRNILQQNRFDALMSIEPKRKNRKEEILDLLEDSENGMTVTELADKLCEIGVTPRWDRNFVAPRLTELKQDGRVDVVGKKMSRNGRMEAVWAIRNTAKSEVAQA